MTGLNQVYCIPCLDRNDNDAHIHFRHSSNIYVAQPNLMNVGAFTLDAAAMIHST